MMLSNFVLIDAGFRNKIFIKFYKKKLTYKNLLPEVGLVGGCGGIQLTT